MERVLVTGFGPFGGEQLNPALEAIRRLEGRVVSNHRLVTRELPVVRRVAVDQLSKHVQEIGPILVLAIGQAGGRAEMTPERVAINVDDYRIADNGGNRPVDEPVVEGGPAAYWSTLPIKAMVEALRERSIPASVSNSAGTFVCNHLFYGLMHHLALEGKGRRGGFVHIPYLPEQAARLVNQPSMALPVIVQGLEIAIEAALATPTDLAVGGGSVC